MAANLPSKKIHLSKYYFLNSQYLQVLLISNCFAFIGIGTLIRSKKVMIKYAMTYCMELGRNIPIFLLIYFFLCF